MGDIKDFAMFTGKVALALLVLNQVPALLNVVQKNYFSSAA